LSSWGSGIYEQVKWRAYLLLFCWGVGQLIVVIFFFP
jgi:hypothetical protein